MTRGGRVPQRPPTLQYRQWSSSQPVPSRTDALASSAITGDCSALYWLRGAYVHNITWFLRTYAPRSQYNLNTIIEHDHRFIKRCVKPGLGFFSIETAWNTLQGYESMTIIRKGQGHGVEKGTSGDRSRSSPACLEWPPKWNRE